MLNTKKEIVIFLVWRAGMITVSFVDTMWVLFEMGIFIYPPICLIREGCWYALANAIPVQHFSHHSLQVPLQKALQGSSTGLLSPLSPHMII